MNLDFQVSVISIFSGMVTYKTLIKNKKTDAAQVQMLRSKGDLGWSEQSNCPGEAC